MIAINQQAIKKFSLALIIFMLLLCIFYAGLLSNWFRYKLSLEATFVIVPLMIGAFISVLLAIAAYIKGSPHNLIAAIAVALATAGVVIIAQMQTFGSMPSFSSKHIEKSPVGQLATPSGNVEYWIELENPFAHAHREYLLVRLGHEQYRIIVPISDVPLTGFASPVSVTDWGDLAATSNPDIFVLTLGPSLMVQGRFQINIALLKAERM